MHMITTACGHRFEKPSEWPDRIAGCTLDCPDCGKLLIMVTNTEAQGFHAEMNKRNPEWPKDGEGTGYVEI